MRCDGLLRSGSPRSQFLGKIVGGQAPSCHYHEQVVHHVTNFVTQVFLVGIFGGHDDLTGFLGDLLEEFVLVACQKLGGVGLSGVGVSARLDDFP